MGSLRFFLRVLRNSSQRKHVFRWVDSLQKDYLLRKRQPWMVFDAVDFLNSVPLAGKRVFEYGSGGSTLYWLSRNMICVSVEHDPRWHESVRTRLGALTNVDYRLVRPERSDSEPPLDVANPQLYLSDDSRYKGYNFKSYASQVDGFPDGYFDVVLVDGRARPACIMHSAPKVKVKGLLILDNAERPHYTQETGQYLRNYTCLSYYGIGPSDCDMWGTNIYVRQS